MNKLTIIILSILMVACNIEKKTPSDTSSQEIVESKNKDWIYLFDGTSTEGWRAYNGESFPPGWTIKDSTLTFDTEQVLEEDYDYKGSKDIIYGAEEFDNFELYVEWKIPAGGNTSRWK